MSCKSGQGGEEKGVPQIEVTPEMFKAGIDAFALAFGADALSPYRVRDAVGNIYCAMAAAAVQDREEP